MAKREVKGVNEHAVKVRMERRKGGEKIKGRRGGERC